MTSTTQDRKLSFSPLSMVLLLALALAAEWAAFIVFGTPGARAADREPTSARTASADAERTEPQRPRASASTTSRETKHAESRTNKSEKAEKVQTAGMSFTNQLQWIRWMKENQPDQYRQIVSNQANWRVHQLQQEEDRLKLLASLDTSKFSADERAVHEAYQEIVVRQAELRELLSWENLENLSAEEMTALQKEQNESWQIASDCAVRERELLLRETARNLGLKRAGAEQLIQEMYGIFEVTGWTLPRASNATPNGN